MLKYFMYCTCGHLFVIIYLVQKFRKLLYFYMPGTGTIGREKIVSSPPT
jgi:hypothetical protein